MGLTVVACPHPLRDTRYLWQAAGRPTVEDLVVEAAARGGVPLAAMGNAVVVIGDRIIPKARWRHVRPKTGPVAIKNMPAGPAIPLIVSVAGFAASSWVGTLGLSAIATGILQAGIGLVTSLLVSALSPAPKQRSLGREEPLQARFSIQGVRNEARPYGVIPRIYGRRVNYYPLLAAQPYTELYWGEQQYLRMLFDVGYGPLQISNLKIGDQAIGTLRNVTYETREGYSTDTAVTLFSSQVREQALNVELKQVSGWSIRTTEPDTDEVTLDVTFPNGLQRITDRNVKFGVAVSFEVQIRPSSGGAWQNPTLLQESYGVTISGGAFEIAANSKSAVRRSVRFTVPRGQWDVQVRRTTIDDQSDNTGDNQSVTQEQSYWTAIRSHYNEPPTTKTGIARIAVRAQATDQLSGVIEQLNCTVVSVLPVWNGSAWTEQATRNPAWVYCDILRGSANARPIADSRIDLDTMLEWATFCDTNGFTFDGVFDRRQSVFECLQEVAATACASPTMRDGKYSVVIDSARSTVVQHFTPRNLRNFQGQKQFVQTPHAVKVIYYPEATQHQAAELFVYDDGYTAANATRFETLELPYTTSSTAAWKRGRRALFAMKLRPEIYTAEVDLEHLVCTRGDLVRVTHDVPMWGLHGVRVVALVTAGANTTGIIVDAPVTMAGGTSYGVRVRQAAGTATYTLTTVAGDQTQLDFASAVATASGPAVGDLVQFGELGTESVELLVRSIEPLEQLGARLTFVDYAPAIQTSDSGTVPDFDPQITTPPAVNRPRPPKPAILSIASDESALIRVSDGTLVSRIVLGVTVIQSQGLVPAEAIQARYRPADTTQDFAWLAALPAQAGEISVMPVEDGETYLVQLRSVSQAGATSDWTEITHTVVGKTTPPPDVERFYRQGANLTWPYASPPLDLAGFVLRAHYGTSTDWGTARALHAGAWAAPPFDISALSGTQTILIKAVDTSGIESANAASVTIDLGDLVVANVVVTQAEGPAWAGSLSGGTDTGTDLEADLLSSPPFWGADAALHWAADGDTYWLANTYDSLVYVATYTPTTDILGDGVLKIETTVTGGYTLDYRISTSGAFWGAGGATFWGLDAADFWDADTIGEWSPFPGQLGPFESTADAYQFRLTTQGGATQGVVAQFDILIDVPDLVEVFDDIVVAATSTRLPITKTYRAIKAVNVTVQTDGNGGVTARIIDKDATLGPDIEVLNASGTAVIGLVDAVIQGY
jgi:hypothetical protein